MPEAVPRATDAGPDSVDRPHVVWWVAVLGGLTLLAFQGWDASVYAWWTAHVNPLPAQKYMAWLFIACIPIHVFEAVYAYRLAHRLGLRQSALGWTVQTFLLGYPSTHLIRKRARAVTLSREAITA